MYRQIINVNISVLFNKNILAYTWDATCLLCAHVSAPLWNSATSGRVPHRVSHRTPVTHRHKRRFKRNSISLYLYAFVFVKLLLHRIRRFVGGALLCNDIFKFQVINYSVSQLILLNAIYTMTVVLLCYNTANLINTTFPDFLRPNVI